MVTKGWARVDAGKSVSVVISDKELAVTLLNIEAAHTLNNPKVSLVARSDKPLLASDFGGKAYQYFDITKSNFENTDLSGATITFAVKDSWLVEKGATAESIALYHFVDKVWAKLETMHKGLAGGTHTYSAHTLGFSYFVIGVELATPSVIAPSIVPAPLLEPAPERVQTLAPSALQFSWLITLIVVALLVLVGIVIFYLSKKR